MDLTAFQRQTYELLGPRDTYLTPERTWVRVTFICLGLFALLLQASRSQRLILLATSKHPLYHLEVEQRHWPSTVLSVIITTMAKFTSSSLTKPSVTPPHLNRQHSYSTKQDGGRSQRSDASTVLASVASRTASPGRKSPTTTPLPSPSDDPNGSRRTSWEDCKLKRDGYISFPDFDQLSRQQDMKRS